MDINKVGMNVRRLAQERGLSEAAVARGIDVSHVAVCRLITENKLMSFRRMVRLAKFFGVSMDEFLK